MFGCRCAMSNVSRFCDNQTTIGPRIARVTDEVRSSVWQSMMNPESLLLYIASSKFAPFTREGPGTYAHEIFTHYGTRDRYRAIVALLSRRTWLARIIAPRLPSGTLHLGVFGGARRRQRADRVDA